MLRYKNYSRPFDIIIHRMHVAKCLLVILIATGLAGVPALGYFHMAEAIGSTEPQPTPASILHAFMIYNGHKYSMSPFVFGEGGQLSKMQFPLLPDTAIPELTLQEGGTVTFDFADGDGGIKIVPNQVYAYAIDYEADVNSLIPLKKVGQDTFELSGISGVKTLELHVVVSNINNNNNSKYISFTKLVDINGNTGRGIGNGFSSVQNGNSLNIEANNNNFNSNSASSCGSASELKVAQILSSPSSASNTGSKSSTSPSTPLTWSAAGEGSWIQLDLGQLKSICSVEIAFANGENSINFFDIQTSTDGAHFVDHGPFQNTAHVSGLEQYNFSNTPVTARFVKLSFQGSTEVDSYNISDMRILGIG